jgi:hypothetical protein
MSDERKNQTFASHDRFLRRIHPAYYNPDTGKVMSAAFQNSSKTNRMSVDWAKLHSVNDTLQGYPGFGVASISAELCWSLKQEIERTPSPDNPAHCEVVGKKPQTVMRKFRDTAEYLLYPS